MGRKEIRTGAGTFFIVILVFLYATGAFAERALKITKEEAFSEQRVALVIGNSAYKESPLKNPVNDATDMAKKLESLGFTVKRLLNAGREDMEKAIRQFGSDLKKGGVGLFYYAGHGMQVNGMNYLIPVGADIVAEDEVDYRAVNANLVLNKMESAENRLNIVLLDACRNNPFARSFRSSERGLAQMDAPTGTLIAYATAPGSTAADGDGRNGVFTQNLLKAMDTHGKLELEQMMKQVRKGVQELTKKGQIPWVASNITGDFYFINVHVDKAKGDNTVVVVPGKKEYDEEEELWRLIRDSSSPEDCRDYLKTYPKGRYRKAAEVKLRQIEAASESGRKKGGSASEAPVKISPGKKAASEPETPVKAPPEKKATPVFEVPVKTQPEKKTASEPVVSVIFPTEKKITNSIGMTFVYVEPGTFMMGSPADEPKRYKDEIQHSVTLTKGYYMQTTEVTQGQWKKVMRDNPSEFKACGDDCPVEQVSWDDVQVFLGKLNKKDGYSRYRLPTEAEWEYACRAGSKTAIYTGNLTIKGKNNGPELDDIGWYGGNSCVTYEGGDDSSTWSEKQYTCNRSGTHPVSWKRDNAWGLHDMIGNVWEWCADWYGDYPQSSAIDPKGPNSGSYRVLRGGSWVNSPENCRSASRFDISPDARDDNYGFRLVLLPGQ